MRVIPALIAATILIASSAVTLTFAGQTPSPPSEITYDEFVKLDRAARTKRFNTLSADSKALIKRTQAERWLADNRLRLSGLQIAAVTDAIAFVTPDIYRQPDDPAIRKREESVKQKLTCALGRDVATQAFALHPPPPSAPITWRSTVDSWLSWFEDCGWRLG